MAYDPGLIDLFTTSFTANMEMKLQQQGSLLRGKVVEGQHVGKIASPINQLGALEMSAPAGRYAPLQPTSGQYSRRWVTPSPFEKAVLIDQFDLEQTLTNPQSELVQALTAACGRKWDDLIINSAFAAATIGTDESNLTAENWSTSFDVADNFGAGSAVGMTYAKLVEARRILRHYHAIAQDGSAFDATLVIGSQQESDLLNLTEVISSDYDLGVTRNGDGGITRIMGFDLVVSERLQTSGSDRLCIAYVKSGLHLGMWKDFAVRVTLRDDLSSQPYQVYCSTMFGATRTQLGKLIRIKCADSTGSDPTVFN